MKNFLIEFFRPLDNVIFNYFVKIGAIKPFLGKLLGYREKRKARKSAERQAALRRQDLQRAVEGLRDPSDIILEAYSTGIYSPETMGAIIGAEERLIPEFQRLGEVAARGVSEFQEASKLRQLGLLGQYGADVRGALEDPRLARLAEMDIAEAERLSAEAAAPLSGERARQAEQSALQMAVRQGRGRGQGAIAQAVLGRTAAKTALEEQAGLARQRALRSASAAMVDPSSFLLRPSSTEEQIFLQSRLGPQITDPGQAINVGSARDVLRAQALLGQSLIGAQSSAAQSAIRGSEASSLANLASGISEFGSKGGFTGDPSTSIFGGGFTKDPTTNIFGLKF